MTELNMYTLWTDFHVDFTYMFENDNDKLSMSTLDHFLTLRRTRNKVLEAGVLHCVDNLSDHEPIYAIMTFNGSNTQKENIDDYLVKPKPMWKKASLDQKLEFNDLLFRKVHNMNSNFEVISCTNLNCSDKNHSKEIDLFTDELLGLLNDATFDCILLSTNKKKTTLIRKCTPGWKEFVEPLQDTSRFWYMVWLSAEKPVNTELHRLMETTRNKFHYQIRRCQRVEEFIKNSKMVENDLDNDLDLFSEIKKDRRNRNEEDVTIDEANGCEIPEAFAKVYSKLYNKVDDDHNVSDILTKVNGMIGEVDIAEIEKINGVTVQEALSRIKSGKTDPMYEFSSDCLKKAPDLFHEYIATMIRSFLVHGYIPSNLLTAIMVPIVKDKLGDICDSSNYRSIALSSLILKLLDWIIIDRYGQLLQTNDFQFGFQQFSSTSLCSWTVFETIDSYLQHGSVIYGCFLDCTKAFDTIRHSTLFLKLINANIPPVIVRILIYVYQNQTASVRWKGFHSDKFTIRNGVRQGAVISPLFFSFYMDGLFDILRSSGSGCRLDKYYAGCFGYADDILLISPSRAGLQEMLNLASKYVEDHNISFSINQDPNKSKTKGIVFSQKRLKYEPTPLVLNHNELP